MKKYTITIINDEIIDDFDNDIDVRDLLCFDIKSISHILNKQELNEFVLFPMSFRFTRLFENESGDFVHNRENHISVPIEEVKSEIITRFNLAPEQFQKVKAANDLELAVIIPDIDFVKNDIIRCMKHLNWNLSSEVDVIYNTKYREHHYIQMRFEPMFSYNANDIVKKWNRLYHITTKSNLKSILQNGLLPKSDNWRFKYPPRVYLIKGNVGKIKMKQIASALYDDRPDYDNESIVQLTIDASKLSEDVDFYLDTLFEDGIYTYNEIPPEAIIDSRVIKRESFSLSSKLITIIKKLFNLEK